jgi:hypothetical protein
MEAVRRRLLVIRSVSRCYQAIHEVRRIPLDSIVALNSLAAAPYLTTINTPIAVFI